MMSSAQSKSSIRVRLGSLPASTITTVTITRLNKPTETSTQTSSQSASLTTLPAEIRNNIYKHYCEIADIKFRVNLWFSGRSPGRLIVWEKGAHDSPLMHLCRLVRTEFTDLALSRLPLVFSINGCSISNNNKTSAPVIHTLVPRFVATRVRHIAIINGQDFAIMQLATLLTDMSDWFPSLRSIATKEPAEVIEQVLISQVWAKIGRISTPESKKTDEEGFEVGPADEEDRAYVVTQSRRYPLSKSAEAAYGTMFANYQGFQGKWDIFAKLRENDNALPAAHDECHCSVDELMYSAFYA